METLCPYCWGTIQWVRFGGYVECLKCHWTHTPSEDRVREAAIKSYRDANDGKLPLELHEFEGDEDECQAWFDPETRCLLPREKHMELRKKESR